MIEKVWAIKGREEKVASNGNKYLQVIVAGDDGKDHKYNLYEQGMWAVFQSNDYVQVQLEKQEGEGKRWEVKLASSVAEQLPTEPQIQKSLEKPLSDNIPPPQAPQPQVDYSQKTDRDGFPLTVKVRTFCISYSKDLAGLGVISTEEILTYAKAFEGYVWGHIKVKDDNVFRRILSNARLD